MSENCFERKVVEDIVLIAKMVFSENDNELIRKICEKSQRLLFPDVTIVT